MERKIGERQRWAWLAAGLSAPVAVLACGLGWVWVLGAGALVSIYYIYMERHLRPAGLAVMLPKRLGNFGRAAAGVTLLWTVLVMGWAANLADWAFPMVDGYPVLGWTVLALAAWGSWKGAGACGRCAGVLCLFLAVLYGVVAVFAVPDVELKQLKVQGNWRDGVAALAVFLLPASVWYVPGRRKKQGGHSYLLLALAVFAAALAAVTAGVLSPELAGEVPAPLYTLAQSVSLFGVVERIEPLLSAAMVMGVFSLLAAMACACRSLIGGRKAARWSGSICCAAAGAVMGWAGNMPVWLVAAGGAVLWGIIPLLAVALPDQKRRNSA